MYRNDPVSPLILYTSLDFGSEFSNIRARPKSMSFTFPSKVNPILSGFKSRCKTILPGIACSLQYCNAHARDRAHRNTSRYGNCFFRQKRRLRSRILVSYPNLCVKVPPSSLSRTMNRTFLLVHPAPISETTFGWFNLEWTAVATLKKRIQ